MVMVKGDEFVPNDEPRTLSIMDGLKATKEQQEFMKLKAEVLHLKDIVSGFEFKIIKKVDDLVSSQSELTNQSIILTGKLVQIIDRFDQAIPLPTVNKLFALVFVLVAGLTGTLQLLDKLK
jgi:hypothetical protein